MTFRPRTVLQWTNVDQYFTLERKPDFEGEIECSSLTVARKVLQRLDKKFKLGLKSDLSHNTYVGDLFVVENWHGKNEAGEIISFGIIYDKLYFEVERDP